MTHEVDLVWALAAIPAARAVDNFSATEVGEHEIVLFDNERLTYHTLNKPAFAVWQLCDGRRTGRDICHALAASDLPLSVESVEIAVFELYEAGLLEADFRPNSRLSRRQVMKLTAAGLAGGALLPAVSSITAPASANLTTCTPGANLGFLEECNCSSECAVLGFFNPGRCCCSSIFGQGCVAPGACLAPAFCMSG